MYYQKNVDYVYLLWEDFVYQIENKVSKKNKVDWHMDKDDPILTTMRFIPKHETVQKYGAILPDTLTNQAMKESDTYKTYYDFSTRMVIPKPKIKATTKVAKSGKKKLPAQGLETLSEIALSEADQMKLITKRSKTQLNSSHASGSGANEGTGVSPRVPDVPTYGYKDEQISWKSSDEDDDDEVSMSKDDDDNADNEDDDDQDDDNEQTESDNDGDDFVHPKFSTHDEEERQDEEDKDEKWSNQRVHTPSHYESFDDESYDEVTQGGNVEKEKMDEEKTNEEDEVNEMYSDVNINLERRDTEMTDAPQINSSYVSSGFISKMLNPNPDTCIDSILNLNTKSTSLVDVPVTTHDEIPPLSVTTLPPPPIPLIQPLVKSLENDFSEFKQTNLFAEAVSSIPGIVDKYLANQMNEAVKAPVQLQSDRLREEAQDENQDFINKIYENIKKNIKEQVKVQVKEQVSMILLRIDKSVNEQLKAEVLICSSNKAKTSHAKTLYKALVDAYETDKDILATYRDAVTFKRRQDDEDEDDEPSVGSNRGSKRRKARKEPESTSALKDKTSKSTGSSKEGSKSKTSFTEDHPVDETSQPPDWFQKLAKPLTPYLNWNKTLPTDHGPIQPWISTLAQKEDPRESFNELMDTTLDFSAFVLNRLKVDTLTRDLLAGPTFELMKGSCKSLVELEYFLEEVYKATTDQLDWNNPEGQQYSHDLHKPLPLIRNLLVMSTPDTESLLLQSLRLSNGIITNIWTGSLFVEMTTSCIHSKKAITRDFVGIKRLHDDLGVNTAKVRVTAAKHNLVLLVIISEKYAK
ncbi:hypothetical protein Tco_0918489 [Tanacetum coccineum]